MNAADPRLTDCDATVQFAAVDPDATRILPALAADDATVLLTPQPPAAGAIALAPALAVGYRLHEYRIESVLGQGGFGITYLATDVHLDARVAIKEYLPEQIAHRMADGRVSARGPRRLAHYLQGLENFLVEARTLASFRHPNIVRVARFFEANDTAYMVLEYERGQSLREWWTEHAGMPERELLDLLVPLLHGLETVHRAGFMHRDIKPDNISVRSADGSLVLLDFGSAGPNGGRAGEMTLVTPGYGPPEQYGTGEQGPWTDLYALGATLYWMLSGDKPPQAPLRLLAQDPMLPAVQCGTGRYSVPFLQAIDWALVPDAKQRPQSVAALRQALFAGEPAAMDLHQALAAGDATLPLARKTRLGTRLLQAARLTLHPAAWPLPIKMTLAMMLAALAPMLITAYYNLGASITQVSAGELGNLTQLADSLAARVAQLLDDNRKLSRYLATDAALLDHLQRAPRPAVPATAAQARLDELVQANPDVQLVMLFDKLGTVVLASDREVVGKNFAFRDYFQAALVGRPYVSGVIVGAVAGQPGIFFSQPARDAGGKVIGAVVLRIKGAAVRAILQRGRQPGEREPFLVDGDGILLHHHREELLYRSLHALDPEAMREIIADRRFARDTVEHLGMATLATAMVGAAAPGSVDYHSTVSDEAEIAGFAPVDGHDWVVGVSEARASFEAPLGDLFANVVASVALVGAIFLLLAVLFARSLLRPIRALSAAADALRAGDYAAASVKVTGRDELGQLARTFNVMIDVVRQRERERARRSGQ